MYFCFAFAICACRLVPSLSKGMKKHRHVLTAGVLSHIICAQSKLFRFFAHKDSTSRKLHLGNNHVCIQAIAHPCDPLSLINLLATVASIQVETAFVKYIWRLFSVFLPFFSSFLPFPCSNLLLHQISSPLRSVFQAQLLGNFLCCHAIFTVCRQVNQRFSQA